MLLLTNVGTTRCVLDGYVVLTLLDAAGAPLPTRPEHRDTTRPRPTVLAPRAAAAAALTWVEISSGEPCVPPGHLAVTPPASVDAIVVAWPVPGSPVCGGGLIDSGPGRGASSAAPLSGAADAGRAPRPEWVDRGKRRWS